MPEYNSATSTYYWRWYSQACAVGYEPSTPSLNPATYTPGYYPLFTCCVLATTTTTPAPGSTVAPTTTPAPLISCSNGYSLWSAVFDGEAYRWEVTYQSNTCSPGYEPGPPSGLPGANRPYELTCCVPTVTTTTTTTTTAAPTTTSAPGSTTASPTTTTSMYDGSTTTASPGTTTTTSSTGYCTYTWYDGTGWSAFTASSCSPGYSCPPAPGQEGPSNGYQTNLPCI